MTDIKVFDKQPAFYIAGKRGVLFLRIKGKVTSSCIGFYNDVQHLFKGYRLKGFSGTTPIFEQETI